MYLCAYNTCGNFCNVFLSVAILMMMTITVVVLNDENNYNDLVK